MPEISRFLGIVIYMLYDDHMPPHFHARYGEYEMSIELESGVIKGRFPRRALSHVLEWCKQNKKELMLDWKLARERKTLNKIPPLE